MEQDGGGYLNAKENPGALSRLACQSFHQDPFLIDTLVRLRTGVFTHKHCSGNTKLWSSDALATS